MAALKPFTLFAHGPSPNPWKVAIILEELGLKYDISNVKDVKSPEFLAINPNGRAPGLVDPNSNITLWESGSIIDYLVEVYDKNNKISYPFAPEKFLTKNWEHFQMSGQGPYYGQKAWFSNFHAEKLPSAIDRYAKEIERVLGVFELQLSRTGAPYLIGEKCTYADLMFVPWNEGLPRLLGADYSGEFQSKFPKAYDWHQRLMARESVKRMQEARAPYMPKPK